jgi:hypothetical protein
LPAQADKDEGLLGGVDAIGGERQECRNRQRRRRRIAVEP